jgi:hypothetical protein
MLLVFDCFLIATIVFLGMIVKSESINKAEPLSGFIIT